MSFLNRNLTVCTLKFNQLLRQQFRLQNQFKKQIVHQSLVQQSEPYIQQRFYSLQPEIKDKLDQLVKQQKIVLFMKGSKESPKCGFSNVITQILRMHGVDYGSVNVLENEEIRQGIKEYSQWPTIPQLFIDGEFIGGCDIVMQMHQNGELITLFNKSGIKSVLKDAASSEVHDK